LELGPVTEKDLWEACSKTLPSRCLPKPAWALEGERYTTQVCSLKQLTPRGFHACDDYGIATLRFLSSTTRGVGLTCLSFPFQWRAHHLQLRIQDGNC
jgi:hypothetical protein